MFRFCQVANMPEINFECGTNLFHFVQYISISFHEQSYTFSLFSILKNTQNIWVNRCYFINRDPPDDQSLAPHISKTSLAVSKLISSFTSPATAVLALAAAIRMFQHWFWWLLRKPSIFNTMHSHTKQIETPTSSWY